MAAGRIGGQALKLGLIDQVVVNLVPEVPGSGCPFFATAPWPSRSYRRTLSGGAASGAASRPSASRTGGHR